MKNIIIFSLLMKPLYMMEGWKVYGIEKFLTAALIIIIFSFITYCIECELKEFFK